MRAKTFNIRFSDVEWARLVRLSTEHGISASEFIRMLLKRRDLTVRGALRRSPLRLLRAVRHA